MSRIFAFFAALLPQILLAVTIENNMHLQDFRNFSDGEIINYGFFVSNGKYLPATKLTSLKNARNSGSAIMFIDIKSVYNDGDFVAQNLTIDELYNGENEALFDSTKIAAGTSATYASIFDSNVLYLKNNENAEVFVFSSESQSVDYIERLENLGFFDSYNYTFYDIVNSGYLSMEKSTVLKIENKNFANLLLDSTQIASTLSNDETSSISAINSRISGIENSGIFVFDNGKIDNFTRNFSSALSMISDSVLGEIDNKTKFINEGIAYFTGTSIFENISNFNEINAQLSSIYGDTVQESAANFNAAKSAIFGEFDGGNLSATDNSFLHTNAKNLQNFSLENSVFVGSAQGQNLKITSSNVINPSKNHNAALIALDNFSGGQNQYYFLNNPKEFAGAKVLAISKNDIKNAFIFNRFYGLSYDGVDESEIFSTKIGDFYVLSFKLLSEKEQSDIAAAIASGNFAAYSYETKVNLDENFRNLTDFKFPLYFLKFDEKMSENVLNAAKSAEIDFKFLQKFSDVLMKKLHSEQNDEVFLLASKSKEEEYFSLVASKSTANSFGFKNNGLIVFKKQNSWAKNSLQSYGFGYFDGVVFDNFYLNAALIYERNKSKIKLFDEVGFNFLSTHASVNFAYLIDNIFEFKPNFTLGFSQSYEQNYKDSKITYKADKLIEKYLKIGLIASKNFDFFTTSSALDFYFNFASSSTITAFDELAIYDKNAIFYYSQKLKNSFVISQNFAYEFAKNSFDCEIKYDFLQKNSLSFSFAFSHKF